MNSSHRVVCTLCMALAAFPGVLIVAGGADDEHATGDSSRNDAMHSGKTMKEETKDPKGVRLLTKSEWAEFGRRLNAPVVSLAENVERFAEPFAWAKDDCCGFAPGVRFMLERRLHGDREADEALGVGVRIVRALRLGGTFPAGFDAEERYLDAHRAEYDAFVRERYPWMSNPLLVDDDGVVRIGSRRETEHPRAKELFEAALRDLLSHATPSFRVVTRGDAQPACELDLGRTVRIGIDRGGHEPRLTASAFIAIPQFQYRHSLGDVFGFSDGWPEFRTSAADDLPVQVKSFFASYRRVFPHVMEALRMGIDAANGYLAEIDKSPKDAESVRSE